MVHLFLVSQDSIAVVEALILGPTAKVIPAGAFTKLVVAG
jgi:hypothetical protein